MLIQVLIQRYIWPVYGKIHIFTYLIYWVSKKCFFSIRRTQVQHMTNDIIHMAIEKTKHKKKHTTRVNNVYQSNTILYITDTQVN